MSLPTAIERLNAHLIGFVRAYTFQLARRIEPQLPSGSEGGADPVGHQAALQAARAIVNTARDKLDVRRMLSALEKHLAGMGRDDSEPFGRLLAELGDPRYSATSQTAAAASGPVVVPVAEPVAAEEPAVIPSPSPAIAEVESQVVPAAAPVAPEQAAPVVVAEVVEPVPPKVHVVPEPVSAAAGVTSEASAEASIEASIEASVVASVEASVESSAAAVPHQEAVRQPADDEHSEAGQ